MENVKINHFYVLENHTYCVLIKFRTFVNKRLSFSFLNKKRRLLL